MWNADDLLVAFVRARLDRTDWVAGQRTASKCSDHRVFPAKKANDLLVAFVRVRLDRTDWVAGQRTASKCSDHRVFPAKKGSGWFLYTTTCFSLGSTVFV